MSLLHERLKANLDGVRSRVHRAAERARRDPVDITLVAVTKYAPDEAVKELAALGVLDLGESRPQLLEARLQLAPSSRWHLIGHLQRNKVRPVLPLTTLIHSVDSLRLLERIGLVAGELGVTARVLLEVNVAREESKDGFTVDDLKSQWTDSLAVKNVELCGLMTIAPLADDLEDARPVFRGLRELRDELRMKTLSPERSAVLSELSMGMSGDFEVAIEEGATLIRVGSALFEGLD